MDWKERYKDKIITPEEAAKLIKPGDKVVFPLGREAFAIGLAISARREELRGIKILDPAPSYDFGWYDEGAEEYFEMTCLMPTDVSQDAIDKKRCDFLIPALIPDPMTLEDEPDIVIVEISTPDEKGFCSFGASLWDKKRRIEQAKKLGKPVVAEVNPNLIRTYGDNFIHISEIDYLVEHIPSGGAPGMGSLAGRKKREPEPFIKDIAQYVGSLIKDGDTIQIGIGRVNEHLVRLGMLDGKKDIGYHSEATPPGIISLVREGVINGRRKTINPGKVVVTALGGSTKEEMDWANENPLFWVVDVRYLEDIRVIAAHDNFVAINQALLIDLSGQISAESIGGRIIAPAGGQIPFVFGALLSNGGRSIHVIPSTAQGGKVSRIVPRLPEGTVVTIQRNCADIVVTEYGIARLKGKTLRQRAEELINVAHPDFRPWLREEAKKMLYP